MNSLRAMLVERDDGSAMGQWPYVCDGCSRDLAIGERVAFYDDSDFAVFCIKCVREVLAELESKNE